jgi:hypothetical protein
MSATDRLRRRIDAVVGGNGFVTISVGDAREILAAAKAGEMLDSIDAAGGKIAVEFPKGSCQ